MIDSFWSWSLSWGRILSGLLFVGLAGLASGKEYKRKQYHRIVIVFHTRCFLLFLNSDAVKKDLLLVPGFILIEADPIQSWEQAGFCETVNDGPVCPADKYEKCGYDHWDRCNFRRFVAKQLVRAR